MRGAQLFRDAWSILLRDAGQAGRGWATESAGGKFRPFLLMFQSYCSTEVAATSPPSVTRGGGMGEAFLCDVRWPSLHPTPIPPDTSLFQKRQHLSSATSFHSFSRSAHKSVEPARGPTSPDSQQKGRKKGGTQESLDRLQRANWALYERRLPPELRDREDLIKNESELIGVVEQRIQQSMREGEFDKLPGQGKPLYHRKNPHIDAAEDLAFRVLNNSGFAPEWVTLNKDIRLAITKWRAALKAAWLRTGGERAEGRWEEERLKLQAHLAEINSKILHYNLITPFGRQIMGRRMERELKWLQEELGD